MTDQEQIAALQAVIEKARQVYFLDDLSSADIADHMYHALASAPSDVLARVKREAAAQALEEAAYSGLFGTSAQSRLLEIAPAIRSGATK